MLVIGGGIAGILCARALTNAGLGVTLVEAGQLCCGVTSNTTAKITIQHGLFAAWEPNGRENTCAFNMPRWNGIGHCAAPATARASRRTGAY